MTVGAMVVTTVSEATLVDSDCVVSAVVKMDVVDVVVGAEVVIESSKQGSSCVATVTPERVTCSPSDDSTVMSQNFGNSFIFDQVNSTVFAHVYIKVQY